MKKYIIIILGIIFTSCEDTLDLEVNDGYYFTYPEVDYSFEMNGRTYIDSNGYYHLKLDSIENQQTLHRFGAHVTRVDKYGLPTQVIWNCDNYWEYDLFNIPMNVPIINGTSHADPSMDSVFCMMAPVGSMIGDTVEIRGTAIFEEGDVILRDSLQIIFE